MRKMLLLFCVVLLALQAHAQRDAPNALDANGKKHGEWEVKYPESDFVRYRGEFDHGKPVGTFFYYYETGEKSSQVENREEGHADAKFFHKNGTLMGEGKYHNAQKHGEWRFYDNQTILSSIEHYEHGKLTGVVKVYHLNGKIAAEIPYEDGRKNGPFKEYTTSGKVLREGTYRDNTYDGDFKQYYDNGSIYREGKYVAAVKDGLWVEYDEDGRVMIQQVYDDGELIKEQIEKGYKKEKLDVDLKEEDVLPEEELQRQFYERGAPR
ncbi:MAG: toxin-antitoxin system YwqK family antitoxin [Cryomorphaceae bacterium]